MDNYLKTFIDLEKLLVLIRNDQEYNDPTSLYYKKTSLFKCPSDFLCSRIKIPDPELRLLFNDYCLSVLDCLKNFLKSKNPENLFFIGQGIWYSSDLGFFTNRILDQDWYLIRFDLSKFNKDSGIHLRPLNKIWTKNDLQIRIQIKASTNIDHLNNFWVQKNKKNFFNQGFLCVLQIGKYFSTTRNTIYFISEIQDQVLDRIKIKDHNMYLKYSELYDDFLYFINEQ